MRAQLLTVCMQLMPSRAGDGGFCIVPGSHKANFPVPPALADLADAELSEFVHQPVLVRHGVRARVGVRVRVGARPGARARARDRAGARAHASARAPQGRLEPS